MKSLKCNIAQEKPAPRTVAFGEKATTRQDIEESMSRTQIPMQSPVGKGLLGKDGNMAAKSGAPKSKAVINNNNALDQIEEI